MSMRRQQCGGAVARVSLVATTTARLLAQNGAEAGDLIPQMFRIVIKVSGHRPIRFHYEPRIAGACEVWSTIHA